jgi:hypothetical protein
MTIESHGQPPMLGALLLETQERFCIRHRVGANLERKVVAAEFALAANARVDPPHGGVKEEQRFGQRLDEVPEKVGAADVGQLMRQYNFKLIRTERCNGGKG